MLFGHGAQPHGQLRFHLFGVENGLLQPRQFQTALVDNVLRSGLRLGDNDLRFALRRGFKPLGHALGGH